MSIACWITKATNKYSEYVILTAFALQLQLHERTLMLGYTYIASFVDINKTEGMTQHRNNII